MAQGQGNWAKLALAACQLASASLLPVCSLSDLWARNESQPRLKKSCFVIGFVAFAFLVVHICQDDFSGSLSVVSSSIYPLLPLSI